MNSTIFERTHLNRSKEKNPSDLGRLIPFLSLFRTHTQRIKNKIITMAEQPASAASGAAISTDELAPTMTAGYKAPAKKTVEELAQLDQEDESLRKWKESLGIKGGPAGAAAPADDPRKVVVTALVFESPDRPDVVMDLSSPEHISEVSKSVLSIKEGASFRLKLRFRIQHDVVSGLKYLHVIKRKGIKFDRAEEMLGSYGPATEDYEKKFPVEEAPTGMIARGLYDVRSKFVDDDGQTHLEWDWQFKISKDWKGDE
ncbi:immunoglobulin E-set [Blastocladiella britannica]|nr:immunoglobulin E-set [Blastocladiella britannica]